MQFQWKPSILTSVLFMGCALLTGPAIGQDETAKNEPQDSQETQEAEQKKKRVPIYDEEVDASEQIAAALKKAQAENQHVVLQWGANWCGWCYLLHDIMHDNPQIARKLRYDYQVVLIDIGRFDRHTDLLKKYEADIKTHGVPYLTVLDADGKVLVNQETASLETKDKENPGHNPEAILEFLTKYEPTPLVAEEVLDLAIEKAANEKKLVFLHFGAPWCGWCHYLEDWLAEPEQAVLHEQFVDVKIDLDRMKNAKAILSRYSEENQGIPWTAIIDPKTGKVIVDSTGPEGNIGFPSTDQEIDYFAQMLRNCGDRFSESDIRKLQESLVANRTKREEARAERAKANDK